MSMKTKPLLITILVLVLIGVGYFLIPKLSKSFKPVEKSIAVLTFVNDSPMGIGDANDIYEIQAEISHSIANEIARITP